MFVKYYVESLATNLLDGRDFFVLQIRCQFVSAWGMVFFLTSEDQTRLI